MSQYSEIMGSFIRTGDYPIEANYIFKDEAALKEFYSDPINATTLHSGLFKVVLDGEQTLYWAIKNGDSYTFEPFLNAVNKKIEDLTNDWYEE